MAASATRTSPRAAGGHGDPDSHGARPGAAGGDVRARIQDAAEARFIHYGFNKTTMAEIAADCGMSAANLYRYFPGKSDIAAHSAAQWMSDQVGRLRRIAADGAVPPDARIRAIFRTKFGDMQGLCEATPHLRELIDHVCDVRADLVEGHVAEIRGLLAEVIADGVDRGVFAVERVADAAGGLESAMRGFGRELVTSRRPAETLAREAELALDLLLRGLAR